MKSIEESIKKAICFVLDNRDSEGMWKNFLSRTHGESTDWVTSFSGINLLETGVSKKELEKTAKSVLKRQRDNGGFSYNDKVAADVDSTAFALRFLKHYGYDNKLDKASKFLKHHQNPDGGFGTYIEENLRKYFIKIPSEISVKGWCSSTPDITASVLIANPSNQEALKNLIDEQKPDGSWDSYWWNSDVYATAHAVEALETIGVKKEIKHAREWLTINKNIPEAAFYLALSIQTLSKERKYNEIVGERVKKLLNLQQIDGSWNTIPILRFPHPSNTEPWNNTERWRENAKDQNRIFTTSTCARALKKYHQSTK